MKKLLHHLLLIMLLGNLVILNGCMIFNRQDGPPRFYIDANKIPNAVPKAEPLSKSGNKNYRIHGKKYLVMRKRHNYVAVGVASWYGSKFHNQLTASGERYNMLAMTAAHRTLPLPTYVKVTNLKNGKQIIVKVNDRGPFKRNRLIDLSYVAAKKLGIVKHGTALVEVKALTPSHNDNHWYKRPSFIL